MIDWKAKLTSRKFWAAIANFIGMLLTALHVAETTSTQITALIIAGGGIVAYILGESIIDAAREKAEVYIAEEDENAADDN